ncbi:tRNA (adenosine(37)-N6)-threonylcarbamoyltransferase complex dimerization subunit type 1 TsaB [Spirochaetia bacterium]|nr:tRNA (adenosine(37)-N6)-threonylcarbamoyltransferase complex dimerization subunit type 1 TsaB [Spirochaetia bacterium]
MNILAIDTATSILSIAVSSPEGLRHFEVDAELRHSELLMDLTDMVMKTAGLEAADLELVACMRGPGSFTGLRIGFAAAKGMALALGIPLVSVPTLDCMAAPCAVWPGLVIPVIDAKKHRFFTALYRGGQRLTEYLDAEPEEIARAIKNAGQTPSAAGKPPEPVLLTGPDAPLLAAIPLWGDSLSIDPSYRAGHGKGLLEIAEKQGIPQDADVSGPLYLRKSDAELQYGLYE